MSSWWCVRVCMVRMESMGCMHVCMHVRVPQGFGRVAMCITDAVLTGSASTYYTPQTLCQLARPHPRSCRASCPPLRSPSISTRSGALHRWVAGWRPCASGWRPCALPSPCLPRALTFTSPSPHPQAKLSNDDAGSRCLVGFGSHPNSLYIITMAGSFYKVGGGWGWGVQGGTDLSPQGGVGWGVGCEVSETCSVQGPC